MPGKFPVTRSDARKVSGFIGAGEKLRRAASDALRNNPHSNWRQPYMRSVRPWQPSTAYPLQALVVNGGNLYTCALAGTSAATGGPTGTVSNNITIDNTVWWVFWGVNSVTSEPGLTQNAWVASTAYTLGQQVTNGGNVYAVVVAGTSAGSDGPSGTGNAITDNTVTWTYMGLVMVNQYAYTFPVYTYGINTPSGITNIYLPGQGTGLQANRVFLGGGGSGYAVGDTINVKGGTSSGTFTTQAQLKVTNVAAGVIQPGGLVVSQPGLYSVLPISAVSNGQMLQDTTSGGGSGATFWIDWSHSDWFKIRGGYCAGLGTVNTQVAVQTFQPTNNANPISQSIAYEFYSDAQQISIALVNGGYRGFSLIIDGIRFNQDALDQPTNSGNWYSFDFTKTTGRKVRHYRAEFSGNATSQFHNLLRVAVDPSSSVWAPDDNDAVSAVLISDSIFSGAGMGPFVMGNRLAHRLGLELGWKNVWDMSLGGTGWTNRGASPGTSTDNYAYRIPESVSINPDIILIAGSVNDSTSSAAAITAAVTAGLQQIRSLGYQGIIVIVGVWPSASTSLTVEDAIAAGVTAFADPFGKTYFVPLYRRPYLPIITGTWNNNPAPSGVTQTTATNNAQYISSGDNTHPPDVGTRYFGLRLADDLREQVISLLTV